MSYTSPFLNPGQYIDKVNNLSSEGIAIDEWVATTVREAADFSGRYSNDFALVSELKAALDKFEPGWTKALTDSRDAASSLSAWLNRLDKVYLDMINMIGSEQDAKDVVTEFDSFINEERPSAKYNLDGVPGPKKAFSEIEGLAVEESKHVISVLGDGSNWEKAVEGLKKDLSKVQSGVGQVRTALNNYATKLGAREA